MALIVCPECGKEISDKAIQCIHCGYPLQEAKEQSNKVLLLLDEFIANPEKYNSRPLIFADQLEPFVEKAKADSAELDNEMLSKFTEMIRIHHNLFGWPPTKKLFSMVDFKKVSSEKIDELALVLSGVIEQTEMSLAYPAKKVLLYGNSSVVDEFHEKLKSRKSKLGESTLLEAVESSYEFQQKQNVADCYRETRSPEDDIQSLRSMRAVRCPRCGSTEITTTARGVSLLRGVIGANKTVNRCQKCGKTWEPKR